VFLGWLTGADLPMFVHLVLILLAGSVLITMVTSTVAYYVAYISYKMGLDPDNAVIPILTAAMDVVGTGSLIIVLLLIGMIF
jgi:mgtE-like transporter